MGIDTGGAEPGPPTTAPWEDADGDGFGAGAPVRSDCDEVPDGYADNDEDWDDNDPQSNPAAAERCDEKDNDCDYPSTTTSRRPGTRTAMVMGSAS